MRWRIPEADLRDAWPRYGLAVGATAVALLVRWTLNPILQGDSPYSIFIVAVLISAWRGGLGPGLTAIGLGAVLATFLFLIPQWSFHFPRINEFTHFVVFVAVGTSVCLLGQRMRSALDRASSSESEALRTVAELAKEIRVRETVEERLRVALEVAEAATQAKSVFMAYMSHEIRTPLNGVLGMLELLGRTELDDRQTQYARRARDSAELLLALLNDVLDFTKFEMGRFELEEVEFRPAAVLIAVNALFAASAEQKSLQLHCRPSAGLDKLTGIGDPSRLRQILINLVGNAIKFSDQGGVTVSAGLLTAPTPSLRFEVRDTGIGIPLDGRDRLFEPFTQADSSMSRRFGGSGLGLAISRHLVTKMGGTIGFDSSPGQGSTFWFEVPFREVHVASAVSAAGPESQSGSNTAQPRMAQVDRSKRILVVEDNPINSEVAVTLIRDAGYRCDLAETGPEALEKAASTRYDLILMDCQLPGLDGFETTRRIRQSEQNGGVRLPILALTASITREVRERSTEAGMDACLAKPIGADDMLAAIAGALKGQTSSGPAGGADSDTPMVVADLDAATRRLGDRVDLLAKLADQFLAVVGELLNEIRVSAERKDANGLGLVVHRLKGQASTFDAEVVVDSSAKLESLANETVVDWSRITAELARLNSAVPALKTRLAGFVAAQSARAGSPPATKA